LPSIPTKAISAPVDFECRLSYENPDGEFSAIRTRTGNPESVVEPVYPATVKSAPLSNAADVGPGNACAVYAASEARNASAKREASLPNFDKLLLIMAMQLP
jgi:hypothetical protein